MLLLLGCSDYGFGDDVKHDGADTGWPSDIDRDGEPNGSDDDDDGDGIPDAEDEDDDGDGSHDEDDPDQDNDGTPDRDDPDDDQDGTPDSEDDDDDGDGLVDETEDPDGGGGGTDRPDEIPDDFDDCEDGYYADYFNLPADHPDVENEVSGVETGDDPRSHDWWAPEYWVWRTVDPNLEFGTPWWPVDQGLEGDPQYFAVYWLAYLEVGVDEAVAFEMASDDDAFAYIDGELVADLGGIHGLAITDFTWPMSAGKHVLEIYFAERHTVDAGFWFKWDSENVGYYACP